MDMKQAVELGKKAQAAGYSTRVKSGKAQLVVVTFDGKGKSTVTPKTDWLTFDEAMRVIRSKQP